MNKSETIGKLANALAAAQAEIKPVPKTHENPYFKSKYADLADIQEATRAALHKWGLAVSQLNDIEDGRVVVETVLLHASGEWISGRLALKPVKDDPQGVGSAITYARRYGLSAILSLATEDDDDGEAASHREPEIRRESVPEEQPAKERGGAAARREESTACPKCGGPMWDNREKKATGKFKPTSPDFSCKDKECGGAIWPEKKGDKKDPAWEGAKNDLARAAERAWPSATSKQRAENASAFYEDTRGATKKVSDMSIAELKALAQDINDNMEVIGTPESGEEL